MEGKKVLITGGLGFIGSNLARRLVHDGAKVTVVDSLIPEYGGNQRNLYDIRDQLTINLSDVRDPFSMNQLVQGQDYLFNLAGQTSHLDSMENPFTDLDINAKAQLSILEACRKHNPEIRIVFASTRQIYGKPQYLPVDEKHPSHPVDINGVNKMAGEWYHIVYNDVYGIPASVLRLTNTYGPRMRIKDARQTFLGVWIRNLLEGKPIHVFGDGRQRRDYNYVDDVVDALLLAATRPEAEGKIFNLGAPEPLTLEDTAKLMCELIEGANYEKIPFPEDRKAIDVGDFVCNYKAFQSAFGWEPKVDFRQGISKSVEYFRNDLSHYI
ncbi:MAG: NAD-dependent epimerase/dehydratase family protein [Verrucomicrobia bacterium]|jgi:UDP-glucose 4-epimerase|nr:NAD-dependent epimerase/dehydratase family protein [Verrucomicrobiota bacterium]MDA1047329.1 NAD-dependent epimerase/dehydratase family protein [Verrucomicrobiota bacterium]